MKTTNQLLAERLYGDKRAKELHVKLVAKTARPPHRCYADLAWELVTLPNGDQVQISAKTTQHFYVQLPEPPSPVPAPYKRYKGINHFEARNYGAHWVNVDEFAWFVLVVLADTNPAAYAQDAGCVSIWRDDRRSPEFTRKNAGDYGVGHLSSRQAYRRNGAPKHPSF